MSLIRVSGGQIWKAFAYGANRKFSATDASKRSWALSRLAVKRAVGTIFVTPASYMMWRRQRIGPYASLIECTRQLLGIAWHVVPANHDHTQFPDPGSG